MARNSQNGQNGKNSRIIRKLTLDLEIVTTQERLWKLRAKAKRIRIGEIQRQIAKVSR